MTYYIYFITCVLLVFIAVEVPTVGESDNNLAIIVGSVGGGILVAVIIVAALFGIIYFVICRNKRMNEELKPKQAMEMSVVGIAYDESKEKIDIN